MGKSIWKYPVSAADEQVVEMPLGAKILTVAVQGETAFLWAEVDPAAPKMRGRKIFIFATGQPMPDDPGDYIASIMMHDGALVFHVYDASQAELPHQPSNVSVAVE